MPFSKIAHYRESTSTAVSSTYILYVTNTHRLGGIPAGLGRSNIKILVIISNNKIQDDGGAAATTHPPPIFSKEGGARTSPRRAPASVPAAPLLEPTSLPS